MTFALFYHVSMILLVSLLLWGLTKRKPTKFFRILGFAVVGFLGAVFFGLGNFKLSAHGLAWYGGFFLFASAWLVGRQKINDRRRVALPLFLSLVGIVWLGFSVDGLLIEPYSLVVKHYEIETTKVVEPLRIVFLTDIQTDIIGKHERKTLELVLEQKPDLILLGGDYLQTRSEEQERKLRNEFNELIRAVDLNAPLGVYAVKGNHEYGSWLGWQTFFQGTHVQPMERTQTVKIGEIFITFLSVESSFSTRRLRQVDVPDRFRIMLGHAPRFALVEQDADILLAGHTHGGQIWIPGFGPILTMTKGLPRKWSSGVTRMKNGSLLIVSNGTGLERGRVPRVRLFCRPDIIVIDIKPLKTTETPS